MQFPNYKNEIERLQGGFSFVAGCDEVGVAPLAGPVVSAACVLDPESINGYRSKSKWYYRVRDSKTTNEIEREDLVREIKEHCLAFGIGEADPETIDKINIHHATLLAMRNAVMNMLISLKEKYQQVDNQKIFLFLDGRFVIKNLDLSQKAVVDGDVSILSVSAASIIAKVHRDNILRNLDQEIPGYGFAKHKGYNTKEHRQAIIKNGITLHHRKSFLRNIMLAKQY